MRKAILYSACTLLLINMVLFSSCSSGGFKWEEQSPWATRAVHALNDSYVWAVDEGGNFSFYDGSVWSQRGRAEEGLTDVFATDTEHAWAVGYEGGIYRYDGFVWSLDYNTGDLLSCVTASDSQNVWAMSERGTAYYYDGTSWCKQVELGEYINDIDSAGPDNVWAVGHVREESPTSVEPKGPGYIYFYNGTSWNRQHEIGVMLTGVSAVDANNVWAAGERGTVLFYDGESWQRQESGITEILHSVTAADNDHVWAAVRVGGTDAEIYFFDGSSWSNQYMIEGNGAIVDLYDISAADSRNVWAVSSEGIYYGSK
jgi:hypothetical protein